VLIKTFTLRFDPRIEGFDDQGLRAFLSDKEVQSVREHFFIKDDTPYWAFVVNYDIQPTSGEPTPGAKPRSKGPDYRSILQEEHWPLFNTLRDWRSEKAKAEGVPPYLVFTNIQLAEAVVRKVGTLAGLGEIRGIGATKVKKYGNEVLALLGSAPDSTPSVEHVVVQGEHEGDDA